MQSIVITGAAGGIGRAVVENFLAQGWFVGAYDITEQPEGEHPRLVTGRLDVTDPGSWQRALAQFHARAGSIDAVDNNAGVIVDGALQDADPEQIRRVVDINTAPGARRRRLAAVGEDCSGRQRGRQREEARGAHRPG